MQVAKCIYFIVHLILAASLRLPKAFSVPSNSETFNATQGKSLNYLKELESIKPPNPCYYRSAGSSQILKLYDYGAQIIAWYDVYHALQSAARDAERHAWEKVMGWQERQYGSVDVKLLLHPGHSMTWGMWKEAVKDIAEFVTHYQFLDMDFDVVQAGLMVGTGILTVF
ncbi:MAG: hypothetical protein Q9161_005962 [Pseudevernia consocians]